MVDHFRSSLPIGRGARTSEKEKGDQEDIRGSFHRIEHSGLFSLSNTNKKKFVESSSRKSTLRNSMRIIFLLILYLLFSPSSSSQGLLDGFVQEKGTADLALSATYQRAGSYYAGTEAIGIVREHYIANLYGSYGVSEHSELIVNVPFIKGRYLEGFGNFQDGSILYAYELLQQENEDFGAWKFLFAGGGRLPLSDYRVETAQAIGQKARTLMGRTLISLDPHGPFFLNLRGGFDRNFDPVPSTYCYSLKVGSAFSKFYAELYFESQKAIGGKDYRGSGEKAADSFRELGVGFRKTGLSLYRPLSNGHGISVSSSYILSGRNTGKRFTASLGWVYRYRPDDRN